MSEELELKWQEWFEKYRDTGVALYYASELWSAPDLAVVYQAFKARLVDELRIGSEASDAARYRWLRDHGADNFIAADSPAMRDGNGPYIFMQLPSVSGTGAVVLEGEFADAAIDAQIAKAKASAKLTPK